MKLTRKNCVVHQCTQCGEIDLAPLPSKRSHMLSCDCKIKKPWKWIWNKVWGQEFEKLRRTWKNPDGTYTIPRNKE